MSNEMSHRNLETINLQHDNGADFIFRGRLFSECSWFDDENSILTRQKLYVTEHSEHVYYIVSGSGSERSRRVYNVSVMGDNCIINNGKNAMTIQFDMLMLAVRGLCGLEEGETPTLSVVEETLKTANVNF